MPTLYKYAILIVIIIVIVGCAVSPLLDRTTVINTVDQAGRNYNTIKDMPRVQQEYYNDLQEAYEYYVRAQKYLDAEKDNEAFSSAQTSLSASNRILTQLYGNIAELARKGIKTIQERMIMDPDSPLKKFLSRLNEILYRAERIYNGEQIPALGEFLTDLKDVTQTQDIISDPMSLGETIGDVIFKLGKYKLSNEGNHILKNEILQKILTAKEQRMNQYPNNTIIITITVIGYTDLVDFNKNGIKMLSEGVEDRVPSDRIERRQFLNKRLSELRAKTVSEYLMQLILQTEDSQLEIKQEFLGKGETLPPNIPPPHPTSDSRRRICKVYAIVEAN